MPIGIAVTSSPHQFDGKITVAVVLASLVAASGGLLFGYDIGITGGVTSMVDFQEKFFPDVVEKQSPGHADAWCKFDDQLLQLFTSSLFLAGMVGGFLGAWTTSTFGRVRTMLAGGLCFLSGAALTALAQDTWMLVIGRIMLGLGVGLANQTVPLYLSELAPAKWRGALNMMFQQATTIGILLAQLINYSTEKMHPAGWRVSLGLAGVPAAILTLGGMFLPETPNSLIQRGKYEAGERTLRKIRGIENVEEEFAYIKAATDRILAVDQSWKSIFALKYRPELTFAILIPLFQQLTGINAIMFYVAPLFNTLGFGASGSLVSAAIIGGVNVLATLIGIALVDSCGRKFLFLSGGVVMVITQVTTSTLLKIEFGDGGQAISKSAAVIVVLVLCFYVAAFAWSWGPLGWLVPSEIQPLETRSSGQAITVAVNFLFTFIIGQLFLSMLCHMRFGIFLFFGVCVVVMTAVVHLLLPETKGVPMEEMAGVWVTHWFWKKVLPTDHIEGFNKKGAIANL